MFDSEDLLHQEAVTPDGQREFQLRWMADEGVGVLTDRAERHWFLLDSGESWYDLTQDRYPPKQKCRCKNDWFTLSLDYLPRVGTEDFREITPRLCCTACGREKRLTPIELDYGPTIQLFEQPISPCPAPRIKYKTYNRAGFWSEEQMKAMADFFLERGLLPYRWLFDRETEMGSFLPVPPEDLNDTLSNHRGTLYLSRTPMRPSKKHVGLWRKGELFQLFSMYCITGTKSQVFYEFQFSAEYLDKDGTVTPKSPAFCKIVKDFLALLKKL